MFDVVRRFPVDAPCCDRFCSLDIKLAAGERFHEIDALIARVGELHVAPVDGVQRVGGSTRSALARGDRLETASLHRTIIEAGRAVSTPTPVNERLVLLAQEASDSHWQPGAMSADELRRRTLG